MTDLTLPLPAAADRRADAPAGRRLRVLMLAGWAVLVLFLAAHHVHWRDEVRAFTTALRGDDLADMLRQLRGEGHPALWYVILRLAHDAVPVREVLPAAGLAIGAAAAALLAMRGPFPARTLALALFGYWSVFEYAVTARNYGIAAALMFLWATLYPRCRERGPWLGIVLALLCNTSAPAVLLAGGLALFWIVDVLRADGWRWTPATQSLLLNLAIAAAGVVACALTIYPTYNDAAVPEVSPTLGDAVRAAVLVGRPFILLAPGPLLGLPLVGALLAVVLLGSLLALVRSPSALVAGAAGLWSYSLFFQLTYGGGYRHQALLLAFLLTLHWLATEARGEHQADEAHPHERLRRIGDALFAVLLAMQVPATVGILAQTAHGGVLSRAADLGRLVRARHLENAAVIGSPDVLVEPLSFYLPNPAYLVRERRWGRVVRFSRHVLLDLDLDDVLAAGRGVARARAAPVLILVNRPLDPARGVPKEEDGFAGTFEASPAQVRRFLAATRRIARFAPAATDESYDVYLLPAPDDR